MRQGRETLNGHHSYAVVNYATASRSKEPYMGMLKAREDYRKYVKDLPGVLPNPSQRICTGEPWVVCEWHAYPIADPKATFRMPPAPRKFVADFDAGRLVEPLEFELFGWEAKNVLSNV